MSKQNIGVEVTVTITGSVSKEIGMKLSKDINEAIQAVVDKTKGSASVKVSAGGQEVDAPLFNDRQGHLRRLLEESDGPEEAIEAIKRGDPIMDRYGATNGCDCHICLVVRSMNNNLPSILYMLESVARENPCDFMDGVFYLSQDDIEKNVPPEYFDIVLRYIALNPNWDSDGENLYYKPVPEAAGR